MKPDLHKRLYETLKVCGTFSSDNELRATFTDSRINQWIDRLPQSDSIRGRIDQTVSFLYEQYDDSYANGLVLFLQVLTDRISLNDACHRKLTELVQELDFKKRPRVKSKPPSKELSIAIEVGDITTFKVDVIALKFAQALFGADWAVAKALDKDVSDIIELLPTQGYYKILLPLEESGLSMRFLYDFA